MRKASGQKRNGRLQSISEPGLRIRSIFFAASMTAVFFLYMPSIPAAGFIDRGKWEQRVEGDKYNRVYSVYTPDLDWDAMIKYAREKKRSGAGTTTIVCFFGDWRNTPDVTFTGMDFSDHYKEHWVGGYWFYADGGELFVKYPAKPRTLI